MVSLKFTGVLKTCPPYEKGVDLPKNTPKSRGNFAAKKSTYKNLTHTEKLASRFK